MSSSETSELKREVVTLILLLCFCSAIAGGLAGVAWMRGNPTINPVDVWCDGAYDFTYRTDNPAAEADFKRLCTEDMADGSSVVAPNFDIEVMQDE